MERIADGVYAIIHDEATEDWPNSNTGVVIGDDDVFVMDATYLPSRARADIALIRMVTDKPVRYVVISHLHRDHTGGTSAYRDAFPGVAVVSGPQTREFIATNRAATAAAGAALSSPLRAKLAKLEHDLASGNDSAGRPLSPPVMTALARNVRQRRIEMADLVAMHVVVPDLTVTGEVALYLGGRSVIVRDRGRGNSPDDVTAFVPEQQVLFTGDIVVQAPIPYLGATWPVEWARVLNDIETSAPGVVVPGHGPVMHDTKYVRAMRTLIESVNSQVAGFLKQGLSLDQMQQRIDVSASRALVPEWNSPDVDADWRVSVRALVERAWHELRGLD